MSFGKAFENNTWMHMLNWKKEGTKIGIALNMTQLHLDSNTIYKSEENGET